MRWEKRKTRMVCGKNELATQISAAALVMVFVAAPASAEGLRNLFGASGPSATPKARISTEAAALPASPAPVQINRLAEQRQSNPTQTATRQAANPARSSATTNTPSNAQRQRANVRYGRLGTQSTNSAPVATSQSNTITELPSANLQRNILTPRPVTVAQAPRQRPNRDYYSASEVEMSVTLNLPINSESADEAIKPVSDVRPIDIAPWQKIGSPYQVNGLWYIPAHEPNYDEQGTASWYGNGFQGRPTANGEIFDMNLVTIAHPTLPIPSLVEVTNLENGRSIVARVNDRGPFADDRLVDVSARGAELLGFKEKGTARVRVRYVGQAPQAEQVNIHANAIAPITMAINAPTQAPQRASAPVQVASNEGTTFVQVGAFASRENAERAIRQSREIGSAKIVPLQANGASLYRVVIGPFDNNAAQLKIEEAKSSGLTSAHLVVL